MKFTNLSKPLFVNTQTICIINARRNYSTVRLPSSSDSTSLPVPIKVFDKLDSKDSLLSYRELLKNKGGIYSFVNIMDNKQYIGSAKDFYLRLLEHLASKKSNIALQRAIVKYGLTNFNFCIYEYFSYEDKIISNNALTELETSYIQRFNFDSLYNFMRTATNLSGYKHTEEAKLRMILRLEDKRNHPMFGKTHNKKPLALISKPGELNPMYGKKHSETTKKIMSERRNKYPNGVGIYDLNDNLISKFKNNVELAKHLNVSKVTVGKYLNSGLVYNNAYRFKVNSL